MFHITRRGKPFVRLMPPLDGDDRAPLAKKTIRLPLLS